MIEGLDPRMVRSSTELTKEMRVSSKPRWKALRERLISEGVSPHDAAVGFLYPDDVKLEMGLIASRDERVFEFTLEWFHDEKGNELNSADDAWLSEWTELSPANLSPLDSEIHAVARAVLNRQG